MLTSQISFLWTVEIFLSSLINVFSHSLRVLPSFASLWCKVLPFLRNQAVIISLELIFGGQAVGCVFPWEGEEAIGQGKRGRHRGRGVRREGCLSHSAHGRETVRVLPAASAPTGDPIRSSPPRQTHRVSPPSALTSAPARLAASPGKRRDRGELRTNKPGSGPRWVDSDFSFKPASSVVWLGSRNFCAVASNRSLWHTAAN